MAARPYQRSQERDDRAEKQEAKHTDAWDKAIAEGAISADAFFDELNSRIDKWPESRA